MVVKYSTDAGMPMTMYFRARSELKNQRVRAVTGESELLNKKFRNLTPSEMEVLSFKENPNIIGDVIKLTMED